LHWFTAFVPVDRPGKSSQLKKTLMVEA
jgi:hypothetical protein